MHFRLPLSREAHPSWEEDPRVCRAPEQELKEQRESRATFGPTLVQHQAPALDRGLPEPRIILG